MADENIRPRELTGEENEGAKAGKYRSFAKYLVFCPGCSHVIKADMYLTRAEAYVGELTARRVKCPGCGGEEWWLGCEARSE